MNTVTAHPLLLPDQASGSVQLSMQDYI